MAKQLNFQQPVSLAVALNASSPTGALGAVIWSTTTATLLTWNGSNWVALATGGGGGGSSLDTYTASCFAF